MLMTGSNPNYMVIVLVLFGAIVACGCIAAGGDETAADRVSGNGTVTYIDLEGGFYGIVADDGEHYLPTALPAEYRQDGLRVAFVVDIPRDTATIQQWGKPVDIVGIEKSDTRRTVATTGTVTYVDLEGGFYGIVAEDGRNYLPGNLPAEYRQDGLRVRFSADPEEDVAGFRMWGTPVKIRSIELIEDVRLVSGNGTVTYVDLEGGFYGIVADDGGRYLPLGLEERYRVDGMRITFAGEIARDTVTIQQWGTPVEIITVSRACSSCGGSVGMANPAAVWCREQGHAYEIRKNPDGSEYGVCIFANGTEVDAWDYYRQTH